jgi:hypothetical protein
VKYSVSVVFLLFGFLLNVQAQVNVIESGHFESALKISQGIKQETMGYRVILASEYEKKTADSLRNNFIQANQRTDSYIEFDAPKFVLSVGDFRTEIEAEWFSKHLTGNYPLNVVIRRRINLPRID